MNHFDYLDQWAKERGDSAQKNPMVRKYGNAAKAGHREGHECGDCRHLLEQKPGTRKVFKCQIRGVSRSAATDHRKTWEACARFAAKAKAWVECDDCCGLGVNGHDCGEDTCSCAEPEENLSCDTCDGHGGWHETAKGVAP